MFCAACGNQISEQAVVCPSCGVPTPRFPQASTVPQPASLSPSTIPWLYVAGIFIPLIGWIGGIYLLVKGCVGHGFGVLVVSTLSAAFWMGLMN
jgi:hypothetical protein